MAIKLVLAAILVASIHGHFGQQQPAPQQQMVYTPGPANQPQYRPVAPAQQQQQQQYRPAAPQTQQPQYRQPAPAQMTPQQIYMSQVTKQTPNMGRQQTQMAQNMGNNNPQLAAALAQFSQQFAQQANQVPVQRAAPQQQPPQQQPRQVQSPFVNPSQMAAFQKMFGGAQPVAVAKPVVPVKPRIDRRLTPCQYTLRNTLTTRPTLTNGASGFNMKSRSRAGQIKAGSPVEVSIAPFSEAYQHLNFTSFIMYARPTANLAAVPAYMQEFLPAMPPTASKHVGVFQVFRQYAAGAGAMKCGAASQQEDSVGAFEDLILPEGQPKPARNKVSVLWWPDNEALKYPEIIFTANIESNGYWYKLSSTPWKVLRPVDIQAKKQQDFKRMQWMMGYMQRMKRRLDGPAAPPP